MPSFLFFRKELIGILLEDLFGGLEVTCFLNVRDVIIFEFYGFVVFGLIEDWLFDTGHTLLEHPFIGGLRGELAARCSKHGQEENTCT